MQSKFVLATADAINAYASGDLDRALSLLHKALKLAPSIESEVSVLVQAAGWLREVGRPIDARAALMEVQEWVFEQGVFKDDAVTTLYVGMLVERGLLWQQEGDVFNSLLHMNAAEIAVQKIQDQATRDNLVATILAKREQVELAAEAQ